MEEETKFEIRDKRSSFSGGEESKDTNEEKPKERKAEQRETASIPVTFSSFILSLATSALINLGQEANPATKETLVDLTMAKQIIDLLSLLQEKTKGNLTSEEEGQLSQTLFALRMKFVELEKKHRSGRVA